MATPKTPATSLPAAREAALATPVTVPAPQERQDAAAPAPLQVALMRSAAPPTDDQALWTAIRNRTEAISFGRYAAFIHRVLCSDTANDAAVCGGGSVDGASAVTAALSQRRAELAARPGIHGADAFQLLKLATYAFLVIESGVAVQPPRDARTGAIVTTPPAPGTDPEPNSVFAAIPGEASRSGRSLTYQEAQEALTTYLQTQVGTVGGVALPYLKRVAEALVESGVQEEGLPWCDHLLRHRLGCPSMIELIWNYWTEEGRLAQAMNAIILRFQNRRAGANDALGPLALAPLRPVSNLLWGRVQDIPNQLSVSRRAHEYAYAYGFALRGRAVDDLAPVESRSQFTEAFHGLLVRAAEFYRADANTTIVPDGFNLLQSLKELHVVLAMAANNQFDELKRQARVEAWCDQWLLSRPEMGEFLRARVMVPYPAKWMGAMETLSRMQGWGEGTVSHYHYLATAGETLLLSVRYGDWTAALDQASAVNWVRFFRPEIQNYIHSYQAVTGVDLGAAVADTRKADLRFVAPPALLAARRAAQVGRPALARPADYA